MESSPSSLLLHHQTLETKPDPQIESPQEQENQLQITTPPPKHLPLATITLSLSSLLFSSPPKPHLSPFPRNLKIPSQISTLSLSSPKPSKPNQSKFSKISQSNLLSPLPSLLPRRRSGDPSSAAAARRCALLWFRADLRVHDNEALAAASNESLSLLPVFLFDPRDFGKSASGFDKTGPHRASFLIESVTDLRRSLQARGSDLIVRLARPESALPELARAVGADVVYAHREVSRDEVAAEERVEKAMEEEGVEVKYLWGSTLYHIEDLPFDLEGMPSNYGGFRERVKGVAVRKTIEALDQLKGIPSRGDVEPGEIPSLLDLGLNPAPTMAQDGKPAVNAASLKGGEREALERLKMFAAECCAQPNKMDKDGGRESIYGANFSCKISPWLATGCLSPRFMFEELKKAASSRTISASSQKNGGADISMNWLNFELLWRDFFRFITKKYSSNKRKTTEVVPATACTGALV